MNIDNKYSLNDGQVKLGYRKWIKGSQNKHIHDAYEILFVISGNRNMFVGCNSYIMGSGDIIVIPPNILHKSFNNLSGSQIFSLYIKTNNDIKKIMESLNIETSFLTKATEDVHNKFLNILYEFKNKEVGFESIIKSNSIEILITLLRCKFVDNEMPNIENTKMMEVAIYINQNFNKNINLQSLADDFAISTGHLCRLFTKETGFNLIEYINHVRVLNAKKILITTNKKPGIVSEICGFGSYTNFGRVFKKLTGVSPSNYKNYNKVTTAIL